MTTFTAGQKLTATDLMAALPLHVGVTVPSFSLATAASAYTAISFTLQSSSNTTGMWSVGSPTKLFAPTDGTYDLSGFITWPATLSTADGRGEFRVNGSGSAINTAKVSITHGSTGNATGVASGTAVLSAGDYLELYVNQNSGSTTLLIVALTMNRISTATS